MDTSADKAALMKAIRDELETFQSIIASSACEQNEKTKAQNRKLLDCTLDSMIAGIENVCAKK